MNWTAQRVVWGRAFMNSVVAALKTAAEDPLIMTGKIRLNTNPAYNPTPDSTRAALAADEAAYSGYTAGGIALTVGDPVRLAENIVGAMSSVLYRATDVDPFVSATVYGWWIDNGTIVVCGEAFPSGTVAAFGNPFSFLQLDISLPFGLMQAAA